MSNYKSASEIVLDALKVLGQATPNDIIEWYTKETGSPPRQSSGTFRNTVKRLADKGVIQSVAGRYGAYILAQPGQRKKKGYALENLVTYPIATAEFDASSINRVHEPEAVAQLPEHFVRQMTGGRLPLNGFLTYAVGDSMAPYLPDGCPVFVEVTNQIIEGGRYAIWLGDVKQDVIKRIQLAGDGGIVLISDNRLFEPMRLSPTGEDDVWKTSDGKKIRFVVRGKILWPSDTGAAVFSQFADLIRMLR